MVLIGLVGLVFWIWMLVHAIQNKGLSDTERILWVLVIIFVNLLGAIVYFFVGRPRAPARLNRGRTFRGATDHRINGNPSRQNPAMRISRCACEAAPSIAERLPF